MQLVEQQEYSADSRQALLELKLQSNDLSSQVNLRAIRGLIFFGVPTHGMNIQSLIPIVGDQPNRSLLQSLEKDSMFLQEQNERFHKELNDYDLNIAYFYETRMSPTAQQVLKCLALYLSIY